MPHITEKPTSDARKQPEKLRHTINYVILQLHFKIALNGMKAKYIHRELSAVREEIYRYFSVITVTGLRQSGKTALLRNLYSDE